MHEITENLWLARGFPTIRSKNTKRNKNDNFKHVYFFIILPKLVSDFLIHWGRVTHICVGKLTIIGSDNGLSPGRRQAIIWTSGGVLLIGPLGTNFSEILIGIQHVHLSRPQCPGIHYNLDWKRRAVTLLTFLSQEALHPRLSLWQHAVLSVTTELAPWQLSVSNLNKLRPRKKLPTFCNRRHFQIHSFNWQY